MALPSERSLRQTLIAIALVGLIVGLIAGVEGRNDLADWFWVAGTVPVIIALLISIVRDFLAGRLGVDSIALVSMSGALVLGHALAGIVVAIMYAGGNVLEDIAVAHAERDLRSLIDRAPRVAHQQVDSTIRDIPVSEVAVGDIVFVRTGEVIPVDGIIVSRAAMIDESALSGEPMPVSRQVGETARSGSLNAGGPFQIRASATASESTYAGILRMVSAAQTARSPFIRMADRYALLLLPMTLLIAGGAWFYSSDPVRGLAVLVVATPCPLILAAPLPSFPGSRALRGAGFWSRAVVPSERLRKPIQFCSTRLVPSQSAARGS
jgi:cation transport ATPase